MNQNQSAKNKNKIFTGNLIGRRWLSDKTFEVWLFRPPTLCFQPGQKIRIVYENLEREYSMISAPKEKNFGLCIRHIPGGAFTPVLAKAKPGTSFRFSGPHGYFTFRSSKRTPVFVATGTGIAPFSSMAASGITGFILLHGVRNSKELYYKNTFKQTAHRYIPCLSNPSGKSVADGTFSGRVTAYLRSRLKVSEYDFYLCGRREMIRDATHIIDDRFPGSLIYTEIFF